MIDVTCPQCGAIYHSEESHIGKLLRCARCGSHVPILKKERAVVHQSPVFPHAAKVRVKPTSPAPTRHARRIYSIVIATAALLAIAIWVVLLRHSASPRRGTASLSDIQEPYVPQNTVSDQPVDFIPEDSTSTTVRAAAIEGRRRTRVAPRPRSYNSLPTGTRIERDIGTQGHGKLTTENGTDEDAVVRLSDVATDQTICWFFVQAHSSFTMPRIPQGVYRLAFTTGLNWIESEETFKSDPLYSEFERNFEFDEQRDSERVQYHSVSVTLNPVPLGNVRTRPITREEFLKGHRHVALKR